MNRSPEEVQVLLDNTSIDCVARLLTDEEANIIHALVKVREE